MKAAIYARVSKETCTGKSCCHLKTEHAGNKGACQHAGCKCARYDGQDAENQLLELRRYAGAQGWQAVEFIDYETGKHSDRAQLNALFLAASRKEFDVVLVWALDRLSREGILGTLQHLKRLKDYGVAFESYSEPQFRTTGPFGEVFAELMIALAAWMAKQERLRISERTKAGLKRAAAEGRTGGRPARVFRRDQAARMRREGTSFRAIARALDVPLATVVDAITGRRRHAG